MGEDALQCTRMHVWNGHNTMGEDALHNVHASMCGMRTGVGATTQRTCVYSECAWSGETPMTATSEIPTKMGQRPPNTHAPREMWQY